MNISLELYRVFLSVAKQQSFSKAAGELFVSQSAVSQSVKTLETKLGFPLFVRTTKKVELTANGEFLLEKLSEAFRIIDSTEKAMASNHDPYSGELNIAATDTLCKYFLLEKIKKLHEKYPAIKIKIVNGTSLFCLELLEKAKIDFAVVNIFEKMSSKFKVEAGYSFADVFIAHKDFDIKSESTLLEISKKPLMILDKKSVTRRFLDDIFLKKNIILQPEIELQNIDILIEMAKIGLGISFVPDICVTDSNLKIIKTKETILKRQYGVVSLKEIPSSPIAQTFLKNL